jgi:phytoene dehydrogenase-like protein
MTYDAVVIGSGPNGLSAAIELARAGRSVCVVEANETVGGGVRTAELTLPGFHHDICSAVHPMAILSPFFRHLRLKQWGLEWAFSPAALAHPLPDGSAAMMYPDLNRTAEHMGKDAGSWQEMFAPYTRSPFTFFSQVLRPLRVPRHPLLMGKFGLLALQSAVGLAKRFGSEQARALFAGCAAHSFLPLDLKASAAIGVVLAIAGLAVGWPFPVGGSARIADALVACLKALGGDIRTNHRITKMQDLPESKTYLFDVTPKQILQIAQDELPQRYRKKLMSFQYGPGVFKVDWALNGPIPWKSSDCLLAATVHIGGTMEEVSRSESEIWKGIHPEYPFVLLAQQSLFDPSRAPAGKHTVWGYCHVPNGSDVDMTERIERQIERFAPGFRDLILARHTMNSSQMEAHNANYIGGDISGGANNLFQILARPVLKLNPYATPNRKIFICSSSTPPGAGVHGMCGHLAARAALRTILKV